MIDAANLNTDESLKQLPFIKRGLWRQGATQRHESLSLPSRRRFLSGLCFLPSLVLILMLTGCGDDAHKAADVHTNENSTPNPTALPENLTLCPEERPEVCTQQYDPACGYFFPDLGDTRINHTYGNSCTACVDTRIKGYTSGSCPGQESD